MPQSGSATRGRRSHVAPLTSVRFFAALYVVFFHAAPVQIRAIPVADRFVTGGYIGVSFFFVLSGFVLGWNYLERFAAGDITRGEFWRARFARVYPVYLVGLIVSAPYFLLGVMREQPTHAAAAAQLGRSAALALSLTQAWIPQYATVWNLPSWSLSVEAFFYALFPLLVLGVIALPTRRVGRAVTIAWAAAMLAPLAYVLLRPDGAVYPQYDVSDHFWVNALRFEPLFHLWQFVIGLLGAKWLLDRRARQVPARRRDVTWPLLGIAAVSLALLMFAAYPLYPFLHDGLLAPLFLWSILLLATGDGVLVRLLSRRELVVLGEASYALYLLHVPVSIWLTVVGKHTGLPLNPGTSIGAFAAYVVLAIGVSVLTLRYIEEPARRAIRQGRLGHLGWRGAQGEAAQPAVAPEG